MRILSLAPLAGPGVDVLRSLGELETDPWNEHVPVRLHSPEELTARLDGVAVLIVEADHVPAFVLEQSALRAIGVCRGDPVNVDVEAATRLGIPVVRAPGRNAGAVADLTLGLILALLRGIVTADRDVRAGRWVVDGRIAQQRFAGRELARATVALIGFGAVGRAAARRLGALGATVRAFDPAVSPDEMRAAGVEPSETLAAVIDGADVISVHAPLSPETRGMIGAPEIARAKRGALFVNTARYGIADEEALLAALRDGRLAGAAFDHFEHEFLPPGHPLLTLENVILTPHIGGTTRETVENHTSIVARALVEVLSGSRSDAVVNPEALAR